MGLGMAQVFARAGMRVVIADIRQEAIDAALRQFAGAAPANRFGLYVLYAEAPQDRVRSLYFIGSCGRARWHEARACAPAGR
jgi:NAD(P)-dependent dehydrogenase (short-subunit alcohol dehydrogenase family)